MQELRQPKCLVSDQWRQPMRREDVREASAIGSKQQQLESSINIKKKKVKIEWIWDNLWKIEIEKKSNYLSDKDEWHRERRRGERVNWRSTLGLSKPMQFFLKKSFFLSSEK